MQKLQSRLNGIRQDISSFLLSVHELSADDDPILRYVKEYSGSCPDDPDQASALLYPEAGDAPCARFDPLHYVQLAADHLKAEGSEDQFSHTGPMPSYFANGKEITRRFDCEIAFMDRIDPSPRKVKTEETHPVPGCC